MFSFVVKYLGFLKAVPLLPLFFDSQLRLCTLITNRELLGVFDEIENEVLSWGDTTITLHKYGGTQFNYKGKEIGHIHSNGILDIRFNRKVKQILLQDGRIKEHHAFPNTGWTSFYIKKRVDSGYAIELLKMKHHVISTRNEEKSSRTGSLALHDVVKIYKISHYRSK